jgi:extracellular factor (EF) 3-hydroxypalmitic acid methyl ester biosynthesis protein
MRNEMEYLTGNDRQLLASKSVRVVFNKDQKIIEEGAPSRAIYFLREGSARVYRTGMHPETRLATLNPGDVCGEMAFLEGLTASASVIADGNVVTEAIDSTVLHSIFEAFPHLGARFYRSVAVILSRRLRETSKRLSEAQAATEF